MYTTGRLEVRLKAGRHGVSTPQINADAGRNRIGCRGPDSPVARPAKPRARMMRQYDLVERVRSYNPNTNEDLLNRAYVYAMKAHGSQTRASGDPYFSHPLEVAAILTDLKLDDATIVAALLHDTIEDTEATRAEIDQIFGPEICALVEGLTKLKRLELVSREAKQAENLRKLLLAIADDVRVLLVKLADRLHNMRTLEFVPPESRRRIAEETLDIYAPLAGRMGMQEMREELEDLSFRTLDPEAYSVVMQRLDALAERNRNLIGEIEAQLSNNLRHRGLGARVYGRRKKPFSIWTKMERKSVGFEQLSDIFGFRVVVNDIEACYRALGIVHTTWPVVPGRFKDYISTPKQNDYRSIHTTVIGPGNQRAELQIRTEAMDQIAERGIAAHVFYKEGAGSPTEFLKRESNAFAWLRHTVGILSEMPTPRNSRAHKLEVELFHDQVFCFTPKQADRAAAPRQRQRDFAYAVHTDVGNSAVGCKINGKFSPLSSELQNGDEVEVLTSEAQSAPPSAWETLAVTGKARAAIRPPRHAHRRAHQYVGLGRRIVERLFERAKIEYADDKLKGALPRLARTSIEDVMAAVGRGEIRGLPRRASMYPDYKEERVARYGHQEGARRQAQGEGGLRAAANPGRDPDPRHQFRPAGEVRAERRAVPGDRIVGIVTPGEGITIYPIQAPALKDFEEEPERWLDVRWDIEDTAPQRFPARIRVENVNEPGALAQIATVIAEHDGNIDNISMQRRSPDFTEDDDRSRKVYGPEGSLERDPGPVAREGGRRPRRTC
uniref:GTP pyrophosphokinase rsh n=1 Tax=Bradyrhizobium japonicum TaxID=375 RepID=Q9RH69_BRAJP|nr:RelA/SpoT homolog [Bradyrhizobium japonicum]